MTGLNQQYDWQRQQRQMQMAQRRQGGTETGSTQRTADYYVYPVAHRTTVADKQTKQVGFLEAKGVAARKAYQYRARWFQTLNEPAHADVVVNFANAQRAGLGAPMPAGVVRVYVKDVNGNPKFVGE